MFRPIGFSPDESCRQGGVREHMKGLDWIIVVVLVFWVLLAVAQGFLFALLSLAGTVVGFLLAARGYGRLAPWFLPYVKTPAIADLAGFLTIFFAVVLLAGARSEEHTSELQSPDHLVCRLLLEKKKSLFVTFDSLRCYGLDLV